MSAKNMITAMMLTYAKAGIIINKMDLPNQTLYLTIPKDSYEYHEPGTSVKNAEDYARLIKKSYIGMHIFSENCTVKYKEADIYWTEECGKAAMEERKQQLLHQNPSW